MKESFRWLCLALATIATVAVVWLVNDVRRELRRVTETVNTQLPEILEKTRRSTETLAELSADIKQLRDLAGATAPRDQSLVVYADRVLDAIAASGGVIGTEKLIGKALKDPEPAGQWVVGARREALLLTLRAKSRQQLLDGLCKTKFGGIWYIQIADGQTQSLMDWTRANVADTQE